MCYLKSHHLCSCPVIPAERRNRREFFISSTAAIGIVRMPQQSSNAAVSLLQPSRPLRRTPARTHTAVLAKRRWRGSDGHRPGFESRSRRHVRDFCAFRRLPGLLEMRTRATSAPPAGCASLPEMADAAAGS